MISAVDRSGEYVGLDEEEYVRHTASRFEVIVSTTTLDEYQIAALRSADMGLDQRDLLLKNALGLGGEAGEVLDHIKKHVYHGHPLDREYVKKELGDLLWYIAAEADAVELTLEEVATANIEKLRKRYPDGFSKAASLNRVE